MYIFYGLLSALLAACAFMGESGLVRKANFNRISGVQYFIPSTYMNALIIGTLLLLKPIAPLFVLWFDRIFFKEKITTLKFIGTVLIIIGVILIMRLSIAPQ